MFPLLLFLFYILHSMSMKVPQIVREVQQAIQDGYCVVIGLQTTGEVCMISELYYVFIIGEFSNE